MRQWSSRYQGIWSFCCFHFQREETGKYVIINLPFPVLSIWCIFIIPDYQSESRQSLMHRFLAVMLCGVQLVVLWFTRRIFWSLFLLAIFTVHWWNKGHEDGQCWIDIRLTQNLSNDFFLMNHLLITSFSIICMLHSCNHLKFNLLWSVLWIANVAVLVSLISGLLDCAFIFFSLCVLFFFWVSFFLVTTVLVRQDPDYPYVIIFDDMESISYYYLL